MEHLSKPIGERPTTQVVRERIRLLEERRQALKGARRTFKPLPSESTTGPETTKEIVIFQRS